MHSIMYVMHSTGPISRTGHVRLGADGDQPGLNLPLAWGVWFLPPARACAWCVSPSAAGLVTHARLLFPLVTAWLLLSRFFLKLLLFLSRLRCSLFCLFCAWAMSTVFVDNRYFPLISSNPSPKTAETSPMSPMPLRA
ncbi:uncharacterized protein EI90DRAFT_2496616 [Cantharellus anzutake]|uniref:uncharacterized protein n=1 Tax=Cantharellus anzutake TaxID=1750568 RepID=UPI001903C507|nr:uncharacterized protein EI90DRAFT_2496616 [Cantharellus anzutake]KAF8321830.1 hypothetical protein EI90DRAFT_2496616 [Cantharellus anzutake]